MICCVSIILAIGHITHFSLGPFNFNISFNLSILFFFRLLKLEIISVSKQKFYKFSILLSGLHNSLTLFSLLSASSLIYYFFLFLSYFTIFFFQLYIKTHVISNISIFQKRWYNKNRKAIEDIYYSSASYCTIFLLDPD